jgi:UDP-N-acetylmuramate dehydrogenase
VQDLPAAALNLPIASPTCPKAGDRAGDLSRPCGDPAALAARMADQVAKRDASQPVKDRSAGSTFRNPAGFSSTGRADDSTT